MTSPLLRKELKASRLSLVLYTIGSAAAVWLYISIYPSLQAQAQEFSKAFASLPNGVLKAFNIEGTGLESLESLLTSKHFNLIWPLVAAFFLLSRAANYFTGEVERGTLGTLLSQPISRSKIFWSKYWSGVICMLTFCAASILVSIPLAYAYGLKPQVNAYYLLTAMAILYSLAIFSAGMLASALTNSRTRVYAVVGGGLLIMYVLNLVANLEPNLQKLKYVSFFHYFDPNKLLLHHSFSWLAAIVFFVTASLCTIAALRVFQRRDYNL